MKIRVNGSAPGALRELVAVVGMLYNVEQLEEIIKVDIDQEFKEMDKELISLQCKVQELTNHVAVLPKTNDQISMNANDGSEIEMSFYCSNHDAIDERQILICFKPTAPDQGLKDVTRLRNLLHYLNTKLRDKLTGGGAVVSLQKISKTPRINNYVMKEYYITYKPIEPSALIIV